MSPPIQIFDIPTWIGVYLLTLLAFSISGSIIYYRFIRIVLKGKPIIIYPNLKNRLFGSLNLIFGQKKVLQSVSIKKDLAGIAHFFIFWGFLSFLLSYILFIYADSLIPNFSSKILSSTGVKIFQWYLDIISVLFIITIIWGIYRRWGIKPNRLSFDITQKLESALILILILILMLTSLLSEGFYYAANNTNNTPPFAYILSKIILSFELSSVKYLDIYAVIWWVHLIIILCFSIYIPISKHLHIIAAPINLFIRPMENPGTLSTPVDLLNQDTFGANKLEDFNRKELLDGYACAVCGRCTDVCPANITNKILSPMHLINNMKDKIIEDVVSKKDKNSNLIGETIPEESLWDCLTCGACVQECPVGITHIDTIVDMRRNLVMEQAKVPETAMNALINIEQRGHPWKGTTFTRTDWAEGLNVKRLKDYPETKTLLWVGCTSALEERSQKIAQSMVSILNHANIDFAILGEEETCSGDPARRLGNEYLYQTLAQKNINTINKYSLDTILTMCPHCFNVIKNEYPHLGGNYNVLHYTEYIDTLFQEKKLKLLTKMETSITYHDSCYLGRHNKIYDPPRNIINSIPNSNLIEMKRCKDKGFCCGAGGGHMWLEESNNQKINHVRGKESIETGADTVAVSCPFCLQMFEEAIQSNNPKSNFEAKDLLEIIDENIDRNKI